MMEYMFFVLQSRHSYSFNNFNLMLEPEETSKGEPLATIDGVMHLLSKCVPGEQSANGSTS
jgi:hypothetical protein